MVRIQQLGAALPQRSPGFLIHTATPFEDSSATMTGHHMTPLEAAAGAHLHRRDTVAPQMQWRSVESGDSASRRPGSRSVTHNGSVVMLQGDTSTLGDHASAPNLERGPSATAGNLVLTPSGCQHPTVRSVEASAMPEEWATRASWLSRSGTGGSLARAERDLVPYLMRRFPGPQQQCPDSGKTPAGAQVPKPPHVAWPRCVAGSRAPLGRQRRSRSVRCGTLSDADHGAAQAKCPSGVSVCRWWSVRPAGLGRGGRSGRGWFGLRRGVSRRGRGGPSRGSACRGRRGRRRRSPW